MPCLIGLLGLLSPRLAVILVVIFSDYLGRALQDSVLWLVLGFLFMPLTLLAYCFAINENGSVSGWYLLLLGAAVVFDLGLLGGAERGRRKR